MKLSGQLTAKLERTSSGGAVLSAILSANNPDGTPFVSIEMACSYGKFPSEGDQYAQRVLDVVEDLSGHVIEDYDTLALAEAKLADAIDDLNHLGELYAAQHGIPLPKTAAFQRECGREENKEAAELRHARQVAARQARVAAKRAAKAAQ